MRTLKTPEEIHCVYWLLRSQRSNQDKNDSPIHVDQDEGMLKSSPPNKEEWPRFIK